MFNRECMKFISTALLLFAVLVAGGCATKSTTTYTPTLEDTRDLSRVQAEKLLLNAIQSEKTCEGPKSLRLASEKLFRACKGNVWTRVYSYADTPLLTVKHESFGSFHYSCINAMPIPSRSTNSPAGAYCDFAWYGESNYPHARDFARAWYVLAHTSAVDPAQEAAFERAAQSYRTAAVKPQLPEEAVKYKVQAELAVQQKRFDDAVELYDQALGIAPWWPAGHYNRGLIFGELQDYEEGIRALQKYLKLEPEASNARAVQLKIYQWESLVPRAAK